MSSQHRKACDTAVTGRGVASGPEFQNRTCTCDTSDCDTAVWPLPVSHPTPRMPSVEEVEEEQENSYRTSKTARFIESYPGDAGKGLRKSKTRFEIWLENQRGEEKNLWAPFTSEQEWALAIWLMKNVGQKSADKFLKLQIVSILCLLLFKNGY